MTAMPIKKMQSGLLQDDAALFANHEKSLH